MLFLICHVNENMSTGLKKDQTITKHKNAPLLIRKASDKKIISFIDTGHTRTMKAQLRRYNRLLYETPIELGKQLLGPCQKRVHRVFNKGKWCLGGRFYGGLWHHCKKDLRKTIRINGESTVELDYSSLHAHMAYAIKKLPKPEGDLYELPGISDRKYGKKAFLMMLNATTKRKAMGAYNDDDEIKEDPNSPPASAVIGKLIEKHHPVIQQMFFKGLGLKFQYRDSKISETILKVLTKENIPCLSVHDSFIVQKKYQKRLTEVMTFAYQQEMGSESKVPKIDIK